MKTRLTLRQAVLVWLDQNKMLQKDLAEKMNVDQGTLSRVLRGYRPAGSIEDIAEKLKAATGIDLHDHDEVAS